MKLQVALLQFSVALADRQANRNAVKRWLNHLKPALSSDMPRAVVIPEIWDVGYALDRASELADKEGQASAEFLGQLAREHAVWFAGGSVLASMPTGFANRGQIINPDGALVAHYDKVHLIRLMKEDQCFTAGREMCLFDLEGVKAGYVTCYDIRFCEWLRSYALAGVEVLFVAAQWPTSRIEHWKALLCARAIENQMYVVACNRCGVTDDSAFGGHSMVIDPLGHVLYQGGSGEEAGLVTIEIDDVAKTRNFLTVFNDRAPEIYLTQDRQEGKK